MKKKITIKLTPKTGAFYGLMAAIDDENLITTQGGAGSNSREVSTHPTKIEIRARGVSGATFDCEVSCEIEEKGTLNGGGDYVKAFKL
jgi:hypothetical protein